MTAQAEGGGSSSSRYREAGVDLALYDRFIDRVKAIVESTRTPGVLGAPGGFGGLFRVDVAGVARPVLVASTDGVGTKLMVAGMMNRHDTLGADLVHHCCNDILVHGARPLFFLDYLGAGRLDRAVLEQVLGGIAAACRREGCALLGGETAEMPGLYAAGDYDLVGTIVGVVAEDRLLDGSRVRPGDRLLGLRSSGLHTNGYSLARRILFTELGLTVWDRLPELGPEPIGELLLAVHRAYGGLVLPLLESGAAIHALAHITGGGIPGNLCRVIPPGCTAVVYPGVWAVPPLFRCLQRAGKVAEAEMYEVFNMGVGMILVVDPAEAETVRSALRRRGEEVLEMGEVVAGRGVPVWMEGLTPSGAGEAGQTPQS